MEKKLIKKGMSVLLSLNMLLGGMISDISLLTVRAETDKENLIDSENKSVTDTVPVLSSVDTRDLSGGEQKEMYRVGIIAGEEISLRQILIESGFLRDSDVDAYLDSIESVAVSDVDVFTLVEDRDDYTFIAKDHFDSEQTITLETDKTVSYITVTDRSKTPVHTIVTESGKTGSVAVTAGGGEHFSDGVSVNANFDRNEDAVNTVTQNNLLNAEYFGFFVNTDESIGSGYDVSVVFPEPVTGEEYRLFYVSGSYAEEIYGSVETTGDPNNPVAAGIQFHTNTLGNYVLACTKKFNYKVPEGPFEYYISDEETFTLRDLLISSGVVTEEYVDLLIQNVSSVTSSDPAVISVNIYDDGCILTPLTYVKDENVTVVLNDGQTFDISFVDTRENPEEVGSEGVLVSSKNSYEVSVAYSSDAKVPEGSELELKEIPYYTNDGKDLTNRAAEALDVDKEDIVSVTLVDVSIVKDEETIEPNAPVDVKVQVDETDSNKYETQVISVGDTADVLNVTEDETGTAYETTADSMDPVYAIVEVKMVKELVASDGSTYRVTVEYNRNAGIPSNAELIVSEINKGDEGYEYYVAQSAAMLDTTPDGLSMARPFDISFKDPETGEEYQPNQNVKVSIELIDTDLNNYSEVNIVHFGNETKVVDSELSADALNFETDGFSVYVLTGVYTYTYFFYEPTGSVNEEVLTNDQGDVIGFKVENWSNHYSQTSVITDTGGAVYSQVVKQGETPVIPQPEDKEDKVFAGWFEGTHSGSDVSFGTTTYDFDDVIINNNDTKYLYARYSTFTNVVFHDQYNNSLGNYPVMFTRRGEKISNSAKVRIDDVSATYSGSGQYTFYGWSETPLQTIPDNPDDYLISTDNGYIKITGQKDLYPIFQPFHWLSFYSSYTGSGATYVPQSAYFNSDGPTSLTVPEWEGHTFEGWYLGDLTVIHNQDGTTTDHIEYSTRVTDEHGQFIPGLQVYNVLELHGGKLILKTNVTLYAKWSDPKVSYKIIVWKQKTDASADTPKAYRYDFAESAIQYISVGGTATVPDVFKNYATTKPSEFGGYTCTADQDTPVSEKGYTVLNVYYDRSGEYTPTGAPHNLTFKNSSDDSVIEEYEDVAYGKSLLTGNNGGSFVPSDPTRAHYTFTGWFADRNCTTQVFFDKESFDSYSGNNQKVLYSKMPDKNLPIYAGWEKEWYIVQIDPNYGDFHGSGSTWFWDTYDGDLVQEYTQVTRDYVESNSGTYFYVKHDRAYYGYSGNEWDKSEKDRDAYYTTDPSKATEDTTFEPASGVYTYAGWYEVHNDGRETPYDFSKHVDHDMTLKLHWKKNGVYYVSYDAGSGTISGSQDNTGYADQAGVLVTCGAKAPDGYEFEGWRMRGDTSGLIFRIGNNFTLNAEYATMVGGKETVYLDAVYSKADTAKVIYDPNGGNIAASVDLIDFGTTSTLMPSKAIEDGKAVLYNLDNNSTISLSNGTGFSRDGMTLAGWSTKQTNVSKEEVFAPGSVQYGVDSAEPKTLYAIWQLKVTFHLNNTAATWTDSGYEQDEHGNYYTYVYLNNPADEPTSVPTLTGKLFRYWTLENQTAAYDFSQPVTSDLDLYAYWSDGLTVTAHAVDASSATLEEKTTGWDITNITVNETPVDITSSSHVTPPDGQGYTFAFAAASSNLNSISEYDAVKSIRYDASTKEIIVTYSDDRTAPLGNREIYFVYYKQKTLNIGYKKMDSAGVLTSETVDTAAPTTTESLGIFNMTESVSQPLAWKTEGSLTHFAYAIGTSNAPNASELSLITNASDSDSSRSSLLVKNTWRGFWYSIDGGESWVDCGYEPTLYVVYFTQQPTIVTIREQTAGTSTAMTNAFTYNFVVTQTVTPSADPDHPETTSLFNGTYNLTNGEAQTAILFFSNTGTETTTQTITVTQTAQTGFTTSIDAGGKGTITEDEKKWTYTTSGAVESPKVTYTNSQSDVDVEVHVATIGIDSNTIDLHDNLRNTTTHTFNIIAGEKKQILSALPSDDLFTGDLSKYAFGTILYGTDNGTTVDPESMEVASISFEMVTGNYYELRLKDADDNDLGDLGDKKLYYLYYPMPRVRYVKADNNGNLSYISGSSSETVPTPNVITYNHQSYPDFKMNNAEVKQNQTFQITMSDFRITQSGGPNTFRMPAILDDGTSARYLSYKKLGAGISDSEELPTISDLEQANSVSNVLIMHLEVQNNTLKWSFDGEKWNSFIGTPTIYAIYEERGYDLQITKIVKNNVGSDPSFTLILQSSSITKNRYAVDGLDEAEISAIPATSGTDGKITLTVKDGTKVKIKGLGRGNYSVEETDNDNYILTARSGPLYGDFSENYNTNPFTLNLDKETKLEVTNSAKEICKIVSGEQEYKFYTLQSAVEYIKEHLSHNETIQMLTDYRMPASDKPEIPGGYSITLNTAEDYQGSEGVTYATITRASSFTDGSTIVNRGSLTLDNVVLDGNSVNANSAMITSTGDNITITGGALIKNGVNNSGDGGAIYASSGTVVLNGATIRNCSAKNGGAVWSEGSEITVKGTLSGNHASENGGAIYYNSTGTINIQDDSGTSATSVANITENSAENGGAIYVAAGTIEMSGGSMTKNTANNSGGAIYTDRGAVNISGGKIGGDTLSEGNDAVNGSALFIVSGTATFFDTMGTRQEEDPKNPGQYITVEYPVDWGKITNNKSSNGGAIGVGSSDARLNFSGSVQVINNKKGEEPCNVYLDQDTDAVINAIKYVNKYTLKAEANIGVYVPDDNELFEKHGEPGTKFGTYTDTANITVFSNDRLPGIIVTADTTTRKLVWGKALQVNVRYLETFTSNSGFPKKTNNTWNGTQKLNWTSYYLPSGNNPVSVIADDLRSKFDLKLTKTAAFACAFVDDDSENIGFENYITDVDWNSERNAWIYTKRDGTTGSCEKLVVYYSEPVYLNIENNTAFPLNISELSLTMMNNDYPAINIKPTDTAPDGQTGYGYVYAVNGAIQETLKPIEATDLQLAAGKSIKLLFPGGLEKKNNKYYGVPYTIKGGFTSISGDDPIPVKQTGVADTSLTGNDRTNFTLGAGKTGNTFGSTADVIFGGEKPICKIVRTTKVDETAASEYVTVDRDDQDGIAYVFSSLNQAMDFVLNHKLNTATIEMLVDYLIPQADVINWNVRNENENYDITFTTAIGRESDFNYSDKTGDRATISRNGDNAKPFVTITGKNNNTSITVENLKFDGKSMTGGSEGGAIKTSDCQVTITNTDFSNFIAGNGGAVFIEYGQKKAVSNYTIYEYSEGYNSDDAKFTVNNVSFSNCESQSSVGRNGGGGIWTNAKEFTMTGGSFTNCIAGDQGGGIFHRIDNNTTKKEGDQYVDVYKAFPYTTESSSSVTGVTFTGCQAGAAGGLETDANTVSLENCTFDNCVALKRNGGGLNVYSIQNEETGAPLDTSSSLTVNDCTFTSCTTATNPAIGGGGLRSTAYRTTITGSTFTGNVGKLGGGIAISYTNAIEATIQDCTITGNTAYSSGGGIYMGPANATLKIINTNPEDGKTISNNTASGNGGGVYTNSATTLSNVQITGNHLTTTKVDNAAGMYIKDKTLTIGIVSEGGSADTTFDTTSITGNLASGGVPSNLHMWGGNKATSIVMNCGFADGSVIGVTNPGTAGNQFGNSVIERPSGFSDSKHVFTADNGSVYGIIDRSDTEGKKIIWAGLPVCKITDNEGNLLYLDPGCNYPATFDLLDDTNHTTGKWISAFSCLRNPTLYKANGDPYPSNNASYPFNVEMLVETYVSKTYITTTNNAANRTIKITTAKSGSECKDDYPYRGTPGTYATIIKSSAIANSNLLTARYNIRLENIILDGGSANGVKSTCDGGIIDVREPDSITVTIGSNAILQNSYTTKTGGAVIVKKGTLVIEGNGKIKNCKADQTGGAIQMNSSGSLILNGGEITDCTSESNGGAVYLNNGTFTIGAGKIQNCTAASNGGAVYMYSGNFTMNGGEISGCKATDGAGGGVYITNNKTFNMANGFIMGNNAKTGGGGIAVGADGVTLNFSKKPWVSGNTSSSSVADSNACNLELSYDKNTIINTDGIQNRAKIGVYVTGAPSNSPYNGHGQEGEPFGTFKNNDDVSYLYAFVNDYNGLRGGLTTGQDISSDKKIYWIKIFSLEVKKTIDGTQSDPDEGFTFKVTLTGTASDGTVAEEVDSSESEPEKYGGLYFVNGVATKMVITEDDDTTRIVDLILKAGETVTAERLPAGLNYTVEEIPTSSQRGSYSPMPNKEIKGYIGENADSITQNRYISTAEITNLSPVCKITNNSQDILYYWTEVTYNWNDNGNFVKKTESVSVPAVYTTLQDAFEVINEHSSTLNFKTSAGGYLPFTENSYHIEMLVSPYTMTQEEQIISGKTITLTTASKSAEDFPFRSSSTYAEIRRGGFTENSMFTANGSLILTDIILNGRKSAYTDVTASGGIVNVPNAGQLTVSSGATLRDSITSGNGGAVNVNEGGIMTVTGGIINLNSVNGSDSKGAGIYLAQGSVMNISGNPSFGGTGISADGSINPNTGNIKNGGKRQDIFIDGYEGVDGDTTAASLVVAGDITSGAGTIWVWADKTPHYKSLEQFAKIMPGVTVTAESLKAFRNAQDDSITGASQINHYLYGVKKTGDDENVYWYGVDGSAHVMLMKVLASGNSYQPLSGITLTICTDREMNNPAKGIVLDNNGNEKEITLANLTTDQGGVFFIGDLPYGTYYVKETGITQHFEFTVDEGGIVEVIGAGASSRTEPIKLITLQ